ncbi:MAG TPA: hypothetical protein VNU71_21110 [Burkholderiaceae bacterium]|nr:hypothetical protein [Burkholderiaceae bacterium]
MEASKQGERRLMVMSHWGLFASFGLAFALSGFAEANLWLGLTGFALFGVGFAVHVLVNMLHDTGFTQGEVALGFVVYILGLLAFGGSWLALPHLQSANVAIGLIGFGGLFVGFIAYMAYHHGVRGSIEMFDRVRLNDPVIAREAIEAASQARKLRRASAK